MISVPGTMKLNTISDAYSGNKDFLGEASSGLAVLAARLKLVHPRVKLSKSANLLPLETSSSTARVA